MKTNLKKITDQTIQALLQNEIILPSSYFKLFAQNAKKINVDIKDLQFEREVSSVLVHELNNINNYMKKTVENIEVLTLATEDAQQAIKDKDENKLNEINSTLGHMKKEIDSLKGLIYTDSLTRTFNKRWIYNKAIQENGDFKSAGLLLLIDLIDYHYLANKYGNLLADNVILYISKFLVSKFKTENITFEIARYSNNQFILFVKEETRESLVSFIKNIRLLLGNTTLKSNSGLMFKTSFHFGAVQYDATENFQNVLEKATMLSNQEKEITKES